MKSEKEVFRCNPGPDGRYITIEAKHISMQSEDEGLFVPSGVLRSRFPQNALDNLDFHEHTPTGVTMHAITHNIYQYKDDDLLVNVHIYGHNIGRIHPCGKSWGLE